MPLEISNINGAYEGDNIFDRLRSDMERETKTGNWFRQIRLSISKWKAEMEHAEYQKLTEEVESNPTIMAVLWALSDHKEETRKRVVSLIHKEIASRPLPDEVVFEFRQERSVSLPSAYGLTFDDERGFIRNKLLACIPHADSLTSRPGIKAEAINAANRKVNTHELYKVAQSKTQDLAETIDELRKKNNPSLVNVINRIGKEKQEIADHLQSICTYYDESEAGNTLFELLAVILNRNHQTKINVRHSINFFCDVAAQKYVESLSDERIDELLEKSGLATAHQLMMHISNHLAPTARQLLDTYNPEERKQSA